MADVFVLQGKITLDTSQYEAALNNLRGQTAQASEQQQVSTEGISKSTIVAANLITRVVETSLGALKNMAQTGIQYNMQLEKYSAVLTTALGSEAEAAKAIEQIKIDAAKTPYSVDGLVQANQFLISAGESAEDARQTIMALSDAISATGGGNAELARMAMNLQQVKNQGKASTMDLRQFAMAGIDIYGVLADYTGKTVAETKELEVTYEMLSGALEMAASEGGKYFDANARQAATLNGQLSTLSDNVNAKLGEAFEGIANTLSSKVLPKVNEFVENLDVSKAIEGFEVLATAIGGVAVAVKAPGLIENVKELKAALATPLGVEGATATAAGAYGALGIAIAASVASAKDAINSFNNMVDSLSNVGDTVPEITAKIDEYKQKLEELGANNDNFWSTATEEQMTTVLEYRNAIAELENKLTDLEAAEQAAADAATAQGETELTVSEELRTAAQTYSEVYGQMRDAVAGYFDTFEKAQDIQSASIDEMIANLQSQAAFNESYAASIATISNSGIDGMEGLADSLVNAGAEGATYAQAIAEAIEAGDSAKVEELVTAWNDVQASQESLTAVLASTQSAFDDLVAAAEGDVDQMSEALDTLDGRVVTIYYNGVVTGEHKHRSGLDYVPYDNYPAILHRGEAVLTATEAQARRSGEGTAPATPVGNIIENVTFEVAAMMDTATVARKTYKYNLQQGDFHGDKLIKV